MASVRNTAVPLGPGWNGILCVPGPALRRSGFGGQEASGVGMVMPITRAVGVNWAYTALVDLPSMGANPMGGWWPSRSLVARWYADADDSACLLEDELYYKANDEGAFDLAAPFGRNLTDAPAFHDGYGFTPAHRYEKAYVMPPEWTDDTGYDACEAFMRCVSQEVISKEVAKVPVDEKVARGAALETLRRTWFASERRNYLLHKGPPRDNGFALNLSTYSGSLAVRVYELRAVAGEAAHLNDWEYHGPDEDENGSIEDGASTRDSE